MNRIERSAVRFRRPVPFHALVAAAALLLACGGPFLAHHVEGHGQTAASEAILHAVESKSRPEEDTRRDPDRKPAELLSFLGIEPGMRVADMMTGRGYYAEILSGVVGPEGKVYAHNSPYVLERFAEKPLSERLARLKIPNVERINADPESPGLPQGLDAVLLVRFYHDFYWMGVNRAAFNKAVFDALKPGGIFGVVDHHAEAGSGDRDARDRGGLHRVDAEMVKKEILAAGFELAGESDVLSHGEDTRDWNIFVDKGARRDKTDRFVYKFRKPS